MGGFFLIVLVKGSQSCVKCDLLQVADTLATHFHGSTTDPSVQFVTLQYALYITTFVCVIGGGFYLATAIFIERDRNMAEKQTKGKVIMET